MSSRPSIFVLQIIVVAAITLFHVLAARIAMRRIRFRTPIRRRNTAAAFALLILLLDLPMVHLFVIYKDWHPVEIDHLFHSIAGPFVALHANALVLGGILLLVHGVLGPLRRRVRSRMEKKRSAANRTVIAKGDGRNIGPVPASSSAMAVPALAATGPGTGEIVLPRRQFLMTTGMAIAGLATSATTLSAMGSTDEFLVEQVVVKIPRLPEALKGTTIAMISDVHSSVFMTRTDMERYVKALNDLRADITVVTGDFVNSKLGEVYPFAEAFSGLSAPLGVYGVTGNHDYYTGQIEQVAREVEQCGIKLLRNENLAIEKNGEKLWLMGMDDGSIYDVRPYLDNGRSPQGTIENMLKGIPNGAPRVFLCHKPYPFEEYSALGMDLMLSGHTHGGQVVIAQLDNVNLSFATLASRYIAGLYKARTNRTSQLYVSRGIGTVGLPIRLNCPPEVTRIVLV